MGQFTEQMRVWSGEFGKEYTDRNMMSLDELNLLWQRNFGVTRTEMNHRFLDRLDRDLRILEVGCNIGNMLLSLTEMGFRNLYGIELQRYAAVQAASRIGSSRIIQASAFRLPVQNASFDLVFTSGVLIHLHPDDLKNALSEIHRCARSYIWGSEYYAETCQEVEYRGHKCLMWKDDFARQYLSCFEDLELIQEERLQYLDNSNVNSMFLLKKRGLETIPSPHVGNP